MHQLHFAERTAQRGGVGAVQRGGQLFWSYGLAEADGVQGVRVARHDLEALRVVPVGPQQRHDLVVAVRQDHVALQAACPPCQASVSCDRPDQHVGASPTNSKCLLPVDNPLRLLPLP